MDEGGRMADKKRNSYRFFSNRECQYFPCHEIEAGEAFNCLFCYCPLYPLGEACGGQFRVTPQGIKDCSDCLFPHQPENYEKIVARMREVALRFPCKSPKTNAE